MQDLKIALVQADQIWEDKEGNYKLYEGLLSDVDSDIIALPEMFNTCFSMNTSLAETMEGSSVQWLKELAAKKNAAVYTSLMINEGDKIFNRGVFVKPDGTIHTYDKRKRFGMAKEDEHFDAGTTPTVVNFRSWNIMLQICYDLRFPEIARNELKDDSPLYDLILYVANWPSKRSKHWDILLSARAIENQSYVVGVNRMGTDANGFDYSGNSRGINPLGTVTKTHENKQEVLEFVINHTELGSIREMLPFLKDR